MLNDIIVGVIVFLICAILTTIGIRLRGKIKKMLNPYPEYKEERKQLLNRIKNKTTTSRDIDYVISLSVQKIRMSKYEKKFFESQAMPRLKHLLEKVETYRSEFDSE